MELLTLSREEVSVGGVSEASTKLGYQGKGLSSVLFQVLACVHVDTCKKALEYMQRKQFQLSSLHTDRPTSSIFSRFGWHAVDQCISLEHRRITEQS